MTIQETVQNDLKTARKKGNKNIAEVLKIILGEFARLKGTKDGKDYITGNLNDIQAERVLNQIIKSEEKTIELTGIDNSFLLTIAKAYVPEKIGEEEVRTFIDTIDFTALQNKMQAVGIVKKHFGQSVDGKMVSIIIKAM